jgi:hypothetical protein
LTLVCRRLITSALCTKVLDTPTDLGNWTAQSSVEELLGHDFSHDNLQALLHKDARQIRSR